MLRVVVFAAFAHGEFQSYESVEDGAAKLGEHSQAFTPAGAAGGFVARRFKQCIVAAKQGERIFAQF